MPKTLNLAATAALRNLDRRLRREIKKNGPMLIWAGSPLNFPHKECSFRGLSVSLNNLSEWLGLGSERPAKRKRKSDAK